MQLAALFVFLTNSVNEQEMHLIFSDLNNDMAAVLMRICKNKKIIQMFGRITSCFDFSFWDNTCLNKKTWTAPA